MDVSVDEIIVDLVILDLLSPMYISNRPEVNDSKPLPIAIPNVGFQMLIIPPTAPPNTAPTYFCHDDHCQLPVFE